MFKMLRSLAVAGVVAAGAEAGVVAGSVMAGVVVVVEAGVLAGSSMGAGRVTVGRLGIVPLTRVQR
jgi:hypothetical protein